MNDRPTKKTIRTWSYVTPYSMRLPVSGRRGTAGSFSSFPPDGAAYSGRATRVPITSSSVS